MIFHALWLLVLCCTVDLMITDSQKCEWKIMRTEGIGKKKGKETWLYFNFKLQNSCDLQKFLFSSNFARKQCVFFNKVANLYPIAFSKIKALAQVVLIIRFLWNTSGQLLWSVRSYLIYLIEFWKRINIWTCFLL